MCDAAEISTYTPYLTMIGGGAIGCLGSLFVGVRISERNHRNTLSLMRRQDFNKAAAEFRAAFVETIQVLRRGVTEGGVEVAGVCETA